MDNNLITVSADGSDTRTAQGENVLFTSKYPFTKIDSTKPKNFQTISVLFNTNPPDPSFQSYTNTLIYQYPHGYDYAPSFWMQWYNPSSNATSANGGPTPPNNETGVWSYQFGDDGSGIDLYNALNGSPIDITPEFMLAQSIYNDSGGFLTGTTAEVVITSDSENINVYILKECFLTVGGNPIGLDMRGISIDMRIVVFAEPAGKNITVSNPQ